MPYNPAPLPPRVQAYVDSIINTCAGPALTSLIVFGSAAIGGWTENVSDVDLILVVPDGTSVAGIIDLRTEVERIEIVHGLRHDPDPHPSPLRDLMDKITANVRSFFICTRASLVSGDIGRILGLQPSQAIFIDRVVLANIVSSGITVWGEQLLPLIPVAPIRRFDVFLAFFGLSSQALTILAIFPLLPGATKYAMGALKRSVHNCYFCYELRRAPLEEEVAFFQARLGPSEELVQLLSLRKEYRSSFAFVAHCMPTLIRLHWRTGMDNQFPRQATCGRSAQ